MISYYIVKTIIFNTIVIIDRIAHGILVSGIEPSKYEKLCHAVKWGMVAYDYQKTCDCCKRLFAHFTAYSFLVSLQLKRLGGNLPWNLKLRA